MSIGIALPFQVAPSGRVLTTADPTRIGLNHLKSYILTAPGERVMRPTFGTQVTQLLFENDDPITAELVKKSIARQVAADVNDVVLIGIQADTSTPGTLALAVQFSLALGTGEGAVSSTTITVGG